MSILSEKRTVRSIAKELGMSETGVRELAESAPRLYRQSKMVKKLGDVSTYKFSADDITNLPAVVKKLGRPIDSDTLSAYLNDRLSTNTRELMAGYPGGCDSALRAALVRDLNRALEHETIYNRARFSKIKLETETRRLIEKWVHGRLVERKVYGPALVRLNRMLLEDAYPEELVKRRKTRKIEPPREDLKKIQKRFLDKVLAKMEVHPMLHGGEGSSPKKAAAQHVKKPMVITMDVREFFPSIKSRMVRKMFLSRGMDADAAQVCTRLVTSGNHVPQGAPTSTCIGRLVLNPVALELEGLMKSVHHSSAAGIWVDDLTLSGPSGMTRLKGTVISIFKRHGFEIHPEKIQVMPRGEEQVSLGVRLNNGIGVPTAYLKKLGEFAKQVPSSNPSLKGMHAYVKGLSG